MTAVPRNSTTGAGDARRPRVNGRVVALLLGLIGVISVSVIVTDRLSARDRHPAAVVPSTRQATSTSATRGAS